MSRQMRESGRSVGAQGELVARRAGGVAGSPAGGRRRGLPRTRRQRQALAGRADGAALVRRRDDQGRQAISSCERSPAPADTVKVVTARLPERQYRGVCLRSQVFKIRCDVPLVFLKPPGHTVGHGGAVDRGVDRGSVGAGLGFERRRVAAVSGGDARPMRPLWLSTSSMVRNGPV